MIRYLKHEQVDRERWNACLDACPYDTWFARPWFLDVVAPGWDGMVRDDYASVFPLARRRKWGVAYAYQPFFTRYFGVFGAVPGPDAGPFLEAIPAEVKYLQCGLHESNRLEPAAGLRILERRYQLLSMQAEYAKLRRGYSENTRRNIARAVKRGKEVREGLEPARIVALFRAAKGRDLKEYGPQDYRRLQALMEACEARGEGVSLGVYGASGDLEAAAFLMGSAPRFTYLKSGVTAPGRAGGAMHALFDHFIRRHAGTETRLDFGGSSVDSVARFYRGFGATDIVYLQVTLNRLRKPFRLFRKQ